MRTLLINMPFASAAMPSIAVGTLQSSLWRDGLHCDSAYLNVQFASVIGLRNYGLIAEASPTSSMIGEWIFGAELGADRTGAYERDIIRGRYRASFSAPAREAIAIALAAVPEFLAAAAQRVVDGNYDVVGFTSSFHQHVASLSLARLLKQRQPSIRTVFGGANCEGAMGAATVRLFPFVDYVCLGEGERSFPDLIRALSAGNEPPELGNIVSRRRLEVEPMPRAGSSRASLDELPVPDYDEYFAEVARQRLRIPATVPIEMSRGCWWGAKHHCTFCGLNGAAMQYASKSPGRVLSEIECLASRYGGNFFVVDNIFDLEYLASVFPSLARREPRCRFFFETKANLRKDQLRVLAAAGVARLQPGIESLSTHVLRLMRKGTSMLQNVQLLKWCRELRVGVAWNLLAGFPGERDVDYKATLDILPLLTHLEPPVAVGAVRVDRFSPFFTSPSAFGISHLRATSAYRYVYPFAEDDLSEVAYYFDCEYTEALASEKYAERLTAAVREWRQHEGRARLTHRLEGDDLVVCDSRGHAERIVRLEGVSAWAVLACDAIRSTTSLEAELGDLGGRAADIGHAVAELVRMGIMMNEADRYLALSVPE